MAKGLTKKQEAFVYAYVKTGSAAEAYRTAYEAGDMNDANVSKEGRKLLIHPRVAPAIEALRAPALAKAGLSIDRTLQEVARLSYFDPRKLYRDDGELKRPDEWDDDTAAAVASLEISEEFSGSGEDRELSGYTKKLKLWDKNAALEKAMKHLGLYEKDNKQRGESLSINVQFVKVGG